MARPGLKTHPKFRRLVRLLGEPVPHVLGYLECLWEVGYQCGNPYIGDAVDVELAAEYPGESGKLFRSLLECRLIDELLPGRYQIHDLLDHAPDYVKKRFLREQARKNGGGGHCPPKSARRDENGATPAPAPAPAPKKEDAGASSPADEPPGEGPPKPPPPKSRPGRRRDDLWDAVVEITGADPKTSASYLGRVCSSLRKAEPPYTPAEVRSLPPILAARGFTLPLTLGTVEKYIGWVRNAPPVPNGAAGRPAGSADRIARFRREAECQKQKTPTDGGPTITPPSSGSAATPI